MADSKNESAHISIGDLLSVRSPSAGTISASGRLATAGMRTPRTWAVVQLTLPWYLVVPPTARG